jgi:16S rRNA (cytosine967-C5)-methyltransferase
VNSYIFQVAAEVISRASREKPADAVLRELLRGEWDLHAKESREVSRAVFAYYRWFGWLDHRQPVMTQIERAVEHGARFRKAPGSILADELRAKTVPGWVAGELPAGDEWLRALQREPKLWLRAQRGQGAALAKKLRLTGTFAPPGLPEAVLYDGDEDLFWTEAFKAGEFEIQDISSQAVGLVCDPKPGETWWDACAGEGGKLLHLSDLMENKGLIWASDRAEWRLKKLKRRTARARVFNYRAAVWNGGARLPTKTKFDGVLVDAPCSGVGTWQRNPHARWTTTPDDVNELSVIQKQLLGNAAAAVKPGGRLVYAVCTLTRSETTDVVGAFAGARTEFEPMPVRLPMQPDKQSPVLTIWPQEHGGNGMFVAAWKRRA